MNVDYSLTLPQSILSSNDYRALNPDQRRGFLARLAHCTEIASAAKNASGGSDAEFFAAIDEIELDAFSIMSSSNDTARTVSPYVVHSSWLFECDRRAMSSHVDKAAAQFLNSASFHVNSTTADLRVWLNRWVAVMQATAGRLVKSSSFTEAVTQLIVIDALVVAFLLFAAASRLRDA